MVEVITITIKGPTGCGKSAILRSIHDLLEAHGIVAVYPDRAERLNPSNSLQDCRPHETPRADNTVVVLEEENTITGTKKELEARYAIMTEVAGGQGPMDKMVSDAIDAAGEPEPIRFANWIYNNFLIPGVCGDGWMFNTEHEEWRGGVVGANYFTTEELYEEFLARGGESYKYGPRIGDIYARRNQTNDS